MPPQTESIQLDDDELASSLRASRVRAWSRDNPVETPRGLGSGKLGSGVTPRGLDAGGLGEAVTPREIEQLSSALEDETEEVDLKMGANGMLDLRATFGDLSVKFDEVEPTERSGFLWKKSGAFSGCGYGYVTDSLQ